MHSEPRQHRTNDVKTCQSLIFALWRWVSQQDKEINRSVDGVGQAALSSICFTQERRSVCVGKPVRRIRAFWIGSGRFSVNWLSLSRFLPLAPFSAFLRGMGGCWKERGGKEGAEMVKGSARLAWRPICICFQLPLEMNCCGSRCVQSFSRSRTNLASLFCTLLSCNLGF